MKQFSLRKLPAAWLSPFLLVLALCADTFTACFVYGADRVKIPFVSAAIITLLSTGFLAVSLLAGRLLIPVLPGRLHAYLCAGILFFLGLCKLTAHPTKDMARKANQEEPERLSPREAFFLGISLSLDSVAAGLGTGLAQGPVPFLLLLSLGLGFFSVMAGSFLGKLASSLIRVDFSRIGGILLILLALTKLA